MARNFCGILNFHKAPNNSLFSEMYNSINFSSQYDVELKETHQLKAANLHSPKKAFSKTSFKPINPDLHIVSFSALRNKSDLCGKLNLQGMDYDDEYLILLAYSSWEKQCVEELKGDWAFVIWDEKNQELIMARNPHASGVLYYYLSDSGIFFSSLVTALLNKKTIPLEINYEKFFQECLKMNGANNETVYKNIFQLKPGHFAVFNKAGLTVNQYWDLKNEPKQTPVNTDYSRELYQLFAQSMERVFNISHSWNYTLSAGKDSAAMIMMGYYLLNNDEPMNAFHFYEPLKPHQKIKGLDDLGEYFLVKRLTEQHKNINLEFVSGNQSLHEFAQNFTNTFGIPPYTINQKYVRDLANAIHLRGGNMALNAQGGNETISYEGISPVFTLSQLSIDSKYGYSPHIQDYVSAVYGEMKQSGKRLLRKKIVKRHIEQNAVLNHDFIKSLNGHEMLEDYLFSTISMDQSPARKYYLNKFRPGTHERLGAWNMIGSLFNVQFIDPSIDIDLVHFINACPNHIFNAHGMSKKLYQEAFRYLVPAHIMKAQKKWPNMSNMIELYRDDLDVFNSQLSNQSNLASLLDQNRIRKFNLSIQKDLPNLQLFNKLKGWIGSILMALYFKT